MRRAQRRVGLRARARPRARGARTRVLQGGTQLDLVLCSQRTQRRALRGSALSAQSSGLRSGSKSKATPAGRASRTQTSLA